MPQLPPDTKYHVTDALAALATEHLAEAMDSSPVDFGTIEIHKVDRLVFNIRMTSNGGGMPRHFTVKLSEPW